MFSVLSEPFARRGGITGRMLDKLMPRRPLAVRRQAMGSWFLEIAPYAPVDGRAWRRITRIAGDAAGQMVVARGVTPPGDAGIRRFTGERAFLPQLTANTAVAALGLTGLPHVRRTVGVVDPRGVWQSLVLRLLDSCATVLVLTDRPQRYTSFCEQVMETRGAPVELCAPDSALSSCTLVLAPEGLSPRQCERLRAPVLSARQPPEACHAPVVWDWEITPTGALAAAVPLGVRPVELAGALYEICGIETLGGLCADSGNLHGGGTLTLAGLAERIQAASKSCDSS